MRIPDLLRCLVVVAAACGWPACQSPSSQTAEESMGDASITAAVQHRLTGDRRSNFSRVEVDTEGGLVQLTGTVRSADQRQRAEDLAKQVTGVRGVTNHLRIATGHD